MEPFSRKVEGLNLQLCYKGTPELEPSCEFLVVFRKCCSAERMCTCVNGCLRN